MPRTSMLESLLSTTATPRASAATDPAPPQAGTALAAGANRLVEAATTEEALEEVGELLGPDARIVDARRVRRGGIGGFFAKEIVQLHVAPPAGRREDRPRPVRSPVDRLLADVEEVPDDVDFGTFLRDQLAADRTVEQAAWTPPPLTPAPVPAPAPTSVPQTVDVPGWSRDGLLRLGLPAGLVASIAPAAPTDDLAWTTALTDALRPSCRPVPAGPCVLVGPRADQLPQDGDLGDVTVARSERWLAATRPDRWVHLVVGGDGWRDALAFDPLAVSWAHPSDLPDAIRCAHELGLVLGFGPAEGRARRARPFEVALAIRASVVRR